MGTLEEIGRVERFFARVGAASVRLSAPLRVGERIYVRGRTTDFQQAVESLQLARRTIEIGEGGQLVGIRMIGRCRPHDVVYRLTASPDADAAASPPRR